MEPGFKAWLLLDFDYWMNSIINYQKWKQKWKELNVQSQVAASKNERNFINRYRAIKVLSVFQ